MTFIEGTGLAMFFYLAVHRRDHRQASPASVPAEAGETSPFQSPASTAFYFPQLALNSVESMRDNVLKVGCRMNDRMN